MGTTQRLFYFFFKFHLISLLFILVINILFAFLKKAYFFVLQFRERRKNDFALCLKFQCESEKMD